MMAPNWGTRSSARTIVCLLKAQLCSRATSPKKEIIRICDCPFDILHELISLFNLAGLALYRFHLVVFMFISILFHIPIPSSCKLQPLKPYTAPSNHHSLFPELSALLTSRNP